MTTSRTFKLGDRSITLEAGGIAQRAHGAALVRSGDAVVLVTVVVSDDPRDDVDFFPLTVEYREKAAAAARIPGGFARRELRLTDHEVLVSRLIDRSIRPLFPKRFTHEVLVQAMVLSADPETSDPTLLSLIGAGAALHLSPIPWGGPVAGVRVAEDEVDLVISATRTGLVMVEGGAREIGEARLIELLEEARSTIEPALAAIDALAVECGTAKRTFADAEEPVPASESIRSGILEEGRRPDGRGLSDVRDITCRAGWLPVPHGSALFTRGETQVAVTCTLGSQANEQSIETLAGMRRRSFMLHYNFPPFSVGEVRTPRGPGRREIGHGTLAARALEPVLPSMREFPYVLRVESDVLASNGSSSMATVCGASLALMDAGVPLRSSVAGIAMGLVVEGERRAVLSDILGDEDHVGDMDFKICGTRDGITALQLDNKLGSLPREFLEEALYQARDGRRHILDAMDAELSAPREGGAAGAPKLVSIEVAPDAVGMIIGPKGSTIKKLQHEFRVEISVGDGGSVSIMGADPELVTRCVSKIRSIAGVLLVDKLYEGRVTRVMDAGAVVKIYDSADGWLHVSEWSDTRTERMSDVLSQGDNVVVRVLGVDGRGRVRLSRKAGLDRGEEPILNISP